MLIKGADVFSQGYRPGIMDKHGLTPEALAKTRPGIIYLSISCYGHGGPFSGRGGWEQIAQCATGRRLLRVPAEVLARDARARGFSIQQEQSLDVLARRVRFIGDAGERIREDYLRILRFFRFQAWYGRGEADQKALAACKALDQVVGATELTPTAEKIRRLMHYGQILQSHALHFFHLSSPDLLFGFDAPVEKRAALWYGIAVANQMAGRLDEAEQALLEARRLYGNIPGITSGSVDLDVTAIELARARNRMPEALTLARAALVAYPLSRAVGQTYAQTLLAAGRIDDVIPYLKDKTREDTAQSIWWDMLARAYADKGKRLEQHRALAEKYARDGAWGSAVEQLKLAREAGDADFYTLSEVDARLHQMERQYKEEKAEDKALPK